MLRVDLPWVPAGEHRVIVRHLTGPDRGRVQLQIDNVNFGPVFDQYSASPGTATLDLGTINFAAGAPRQIKYTVQSKNVASSGHTVSADYIDFQPVVPSISIEAEASNVQRFSSGPTILITNDGSASGGQHVTLAAANPPVLRLAVPSLPAGSHVYTIRYRTGPDQGRFQPMINEVPVGPVIDQYAASVGWTQTTLGTSLLPFAGTQQFKFVGAGKNASASAGNLSVDLLLLDQTGPAPTFVFEAEASNVQRFSSGPPIVIANENNASGGQHVTLDHPSQGPVLRLDVPNVAVGSYGLWVRFRAGPDRGIFQPSINQINVGSPIDQYAASTGYRQVYAGQFTVTTAGTQQFRLVGAGKNASSSAFNLSCDLIAFD